jgi:DNA polymerase III subunit alpha
MPPDFRYSDSTWSINPEESSVIAGFTSVPGIADKTATAILRARNDKSFEDWPDLIRAYGVGIKTVESMKQWCESDDPFGLERTGRILARVIDAIVNGKLQAPKPTHDGDEVAALVAPEWGSRDKGKPITFIGIVKARIYQDVVENIHSRTGDELDEIIERLRHPELRKYCTLQCFDATQEEVYGRISRYSFPKFRRLLETIEVGHDVVIFTGHKTPGFGNSVAVEKLYVIDPDLRFD